MPEKVAILCSDLHLSHSPPVARSGEPDWYEAMARPLRELRDLAEAGGLTVLCGGDVFDRWNSPPKLITFAMQQLPEQFCSVMGQHDLPYHSWEQRESSAFWTLVEAGKAELSSGWMKRNGLAWRGFQWDEEIEPLDHGTEPLSVCVAHRYVWMGSRSRLPIERDGNHLGSMLRKLWGYRVVLLGDNHFGFLYTNEKRQQTVFNAGTFMRRRTDEQNYKPMVGILFEDGTVEQHHLDTSQDKLDSTEKVQQAEHTLVELDSFIEELRKLGEGGLDFQRAVEEMMLREQVSKEVRRVILEAMEKGASR